MSNNVEDNLSFPNINLTDKIKLEYMNVNVHDRYLVIKQNISENDYVEIVKVADMSLGKVFIDAIIREIKDKKKKDVAVRKLKYFWEIVRKYDPLLQIEMY